MGPLEKLKLRLVNGLDSEDIETVEHIEARKAELLARKAELEARNAEFEAKPAAPEPETAAGFFDRKDAETLRGSLDAQQKAHDEAIRKEEEEKAAIKDAMRYALSCYARGLRELPELSKAANLSYTQFRTGFSCTEIRTYTHESRGFLKTERTQEEKRGHADYYADSDGRIEKRWESDDMYIYRSRKPEISEVTVDDFVEAMERAIDELRISTRESSFILILHDYTLHQLVLKGGKEYMDGSWYYTPATYRLVESLKSRKEIERSVKDLLLSQLGMK